jgi:hypothetical protein
LERKLKSGGASILFSEMTPPPELEDEFNAWYDTEHIPIRMKSPGFLGAQRYRDGDTRNYLAVYELTSPEALSTPTYDRIKKQPSDTTRRMLGAVSGFSRYLGRQLTSRCRAGMADGFTDAAVLFAVFFQAPTDRIADFDAWYEEDHLPILMEDERWLGVRRFDIFDGTPNPYNRLALLYLSDRSALDSPAGKKARATDWRARLASEPWFKGTYLLFDRLGSRFEGEE